LIREPHTPFRTTRGEPALLSRALRVVALPVVMFAAACLVALGLFPVFGGVGYAVKAVDSRLLTGKGTISIPQFPERSSIYSANKKLLATLYLNENRVYVTLDQIDHYAQQAVLDIEDHKFYQHGPIDVSSIIRAAIANIRAGKVVQGASTISQQLIKNTLTGGADTFQRKFQEAQDAILLEKSYTKSHILELYLNQAYFGYQVYGIGTAADYYFGVPASKLTLAQAALLAGMLQAPVDYDPIKHPDAAHRPPRRGPGRDAQVRRHHPDRIPRRDRHPSQAVIQRPDREQQRPGALLDVLRGPGVRVEPFVRQDRRRPPQASPPGRD